MWVIPTCIVLCTPYTYYIWLTTTTATSTTSTIQLQLQQQQPLQHIPTYTNNIQHSVAWTTTTATIDTAIATWIHARHMQKHIVHMYVFTYSIWPIAYAAIVPNRIQQQNETKTIKKRKSRQY